MPVDHASNSSWEDESPALPVAIGDVLDGKYKIIRVLGRGGMGVVMAAVHVQLGHRIALKFLSRSGAKNEETLARFALEARAAAMIRSEHATRILDIGRLEGGEPYMVLEMLEGSDLGAHVTRRGALSIADAVTYVLEACEAIAEAHSLGIVHRDLKPDNLFLATRPDGTQIVKVLDFGISKFSSLANDKLGMGPVLTTTSAVIGSPMYMSPEQLRSTRNVDHRSDIWSIAVTLYELISGQIPFPWQSMAELSAAILKDAPVPLSDRIRAVPPELDAVMARCLEKNPDDRYANIAELAWALVPFGHPRAVHSAERATELLARAASKAKTTASAQRRADPDDTTLVAHKVVAVPMGATRPAAGTSTTKQFNQLAVSLPMHALRGLPIAVIAMFVVIVGVTSLELRSRLAPKTHVLEARRGIASAMATHSFATITPIGANAAPAPVTSTDTSTDTAQPLPAASSVPKTKAAARKQPSQVRIVREPAPEAPKRAPTPVWRRNPFADRE
ncbi:MAG: serine/threonine protein kinase [Polyangiaceae bacterium]|nr:serine/threonine protein kinase [Polyangiaceae bacterium]